LDISAYWTDRRHPEEAYAVSLLQEPLRALDQIEWYLANQEQERFPSAFQLAAGNLARQVVEQVLFIIAFYGGLPRNKYMKSDYRLKTADYVFQELCKTGPAGVDYFRACALRGSRLRKFTSLRRRLSRWRSKFNTPSHFRNPAARRRTSEADIERFVATMRRTFDEVDSLLITAAVNELLSTGRVKAALGPEPTCTPAVQVETTARIKHLRVEDGRLSLNVPAADIRIVPADQEVTLRRSHKVIIVQHRPGMALQANVVTETGARVDLSSMATILFSLAPTAALRRKLVRHLRRLGVRVADGAAGETVVHAY
jgi:hypothetical protein